MLVQTVQKFVEILQLQFIDSLVHVPVVMQRLVPMVQTVQVGLEARAAHLLDDEFWVFFWALHTGAGLGVVSTGTRPP